MKLAISLIKEVEWYEEDVDLQGIAERLELPPNDGNAIDWYDLEGEQYFSIGVIEWE